MLIGFGQARVLSSKLFLVMMFVGLRGSPLVSFIATC